MYVMEPAQRLQMKTTALGSCWKYPRLQAHLLYLTLTRSLKLGLHVNTNVAYFE